MNWKRTRETGKVVPRLLIAILGAFALIQTATAQQEPKPARFPIHADDIAFGDPSAPLDMIIYTSPSCRHCADFHLNQFERLQRDYVETGKLYLIVRPIVATAKAALEYGLVSVCAAQIGGPEGYASTLEKLSSGVRDREGAYTTGLKGEEMIEALLAEAYERPADRAAMAACVEDRPVREALQRNMDSLAGLSEPFFPAFVIDDAEAVFGPYPAAINSDDNLYKRLDTRIAFCAEFMISRSCR